MEQYELRSVSTQNGAISYHLERKMVKNLNLRIRKDGQVYVSANPCVPESEIDEFVTRKSDYILGAIQKFQAMAELHSEPKQYVSGETFYIQGRGIRLNITQSTKESISSDGVYLQLLVKDPDDFSRKQRMVNRYLDKQCRQVFGEVLEELHPIFGKYGIAMPVLRIRDMDTRWGSCLAKKGIITLNKRLLEAPRNCIEYVVMHELCHFLHPNHSKHFYGFLTMLMPDWKERKKTLDRCAGFWL